MYGYFCYDRWNLKTELEHMERIDSDIMERTLSYYHQFDFSTFTSADVQNALQKEQLSAFRFCSFTLARSTTIVRTNGKKAKRLTLDQFGNNVGLYTRCILPIIASTNVCLLWI